MNSTQIRKKLIVLSMAFGSSTSIHICSAQTGGFPEPHRPYHIESLAAQQQMVKDPTGNVVGGTEGPDQVWVLVPEHADALSIDATTNVYIRFFKTAQYLELHSADVNTPVTLVPEEARRPEQLWRLIPTAKPGYFKLKMTAPGVDSFIAAEAPPHNHIWSNGPSTPEAQSWRFIPQRRHPAPTPDDHH